MYIATIDNKEQILSLVTKRVDELIEEFTTAPKDEKIILIEEDKAILVGMTMPSRLGLLAVDVLWYVVPEERGNGLGSTLLDAFEYWAIKVGCDVISITTLNPSIGKEYFEQRDYKLIDLAYIKKLKE